MRCDVCRVTARAGTRDSTAERGVSLPSLCGDLRITWEEE